jgi:hypothetical protein
LLLEDGVKMTKEPIERVLKRLNYQRGQFASDPLIKWINDHAMSLPNSRQRSELLVIAAELQAKAKRAIELIEMQIEELKTESQRD